jgi:hypothetical protein
LQSSSATPLQVLRTHAHAVILISANGVVTPEVDRAIADSGADIELISHPLAAMAALACLEIPGPEAPSRHGNGRTLLVFADREIGNLCSLITSVQTRLPRVAIWVFEGEMAMPVRSGDGDPARAEAVAPPRSTDSARAARPNHPAPSKPPQLRIAPIDRQADLPLKDKQTPESDMSARAGEDDNTERMNEELTDADIASAAVTREELDMLLDILRPNENDERDERDELGAGGGPRKGGKP